MSIDRQMDSLIYRIGYYGIICFNRVSDMSSQLIDNLLIMLTSVTNVFEPNTFVFFDKQDVPVSLKTVKEFQDNDHTYYELNKRLFFNKSDKKTKNLPYLSATVKMENDKTYDLTDWISKVKYSTSSIPNMKRILMTWSLESRILLDISKNYSIELIDDNGDCNTIFLNSEDITGQVKENNADEMKENTEDKMKENTEDKVKKLWVKKRSIGDSSSPSGSK